MERFTVSETEDIILYPGAQITYSYLDQKVPGSGWITLRTEDVGAEVQARYTEILAHDNWVDASQVGNEVTRDVYFVQLSRADSVSARRILLVTINRISGGGSEVHLIFKRWPDVTKLPLYPGATHVNVRWDKEVSSVSPEQVTTLVVQATREEIESYYKEIMIQAGWGLAAENKKSELAFNFLSTNPYYVQQSTLSYVTVDTEQLPNGETKVELRASGTEAKP